MPKKVGMFEDCLTHEEVAAMAALAPSTVKMKHREMGIPSIFMAGKTYFLKSEVEEWVRKQAFRRRRAA